MLEFTKDTAWLLLHNLLHGYQSLTFSVDDTKILLRTTYKRKLDGSFNPLQSTKLMCDCLNFYIQHKNVLDA